MLFAALTDVGETMKFLQILYDLAAEGVQTIIINGVVHQVSQLISQILENL